MKQRHSSLDFLCGILIINMIYRHLCAFTGAQISPYNPISLVSLNVFFWYMPWFYFKSGMFFKPDKNSKFIIKSGSALLIPFLKYTVLGFFIFFIGQYIQFGRIDCTHTLISALRKIITDGAVDIANPPLWFLFSLFLTKNMYNLVYRLSTNKIILLSFTLICGIWGVFVHNTEIKLPLYFVNAFVGCFFFGMGTFLKDIQFNKSVLCLSFLIFITTRAFDFSFVDIRNNQLFMGHYPIWLVAALAGIIIGNNIARHITWKKYNPFIHIGKYSMNFYVSHWYIIMIANIIDTNLSIKPFGVNNAFVISLVASFALLPLFDYIIRNKFKLCFQ